MTEVTIVQSSPIMQDEEQREALQPKRHYYAKYPFDDLLPGQSFTVAYDDNKNKVKTLRARAKQKTGAGVEFCVIVHEEENLIEVGRIS